MRLAGAGSVQLVSSFALQYENSKNPNIDNSSRIADLLRQAGDHVQYDPTVLARAGELERHGILGMDAIHIACAEWVGADFFISCDDKLIKKLQRIGNERIKVRFDNLIDFVAREVFKL